MSDLIERLSKAERGSRELDGDIAEELQLAPAYEVTFGKKYALHRRGKGSWYGAEGSFWHPPEFTQSIDAALTLAPDEYEIGVAWARDDRHAVASMGVNAISGFARGEGEAKSLDRQHAIALALCIAALRAREGEGR